MEKYTNTWRLSNTLLNKHWIKREIKTDLKNSKWSLQKTHIYNENNIKWKYKEENFSEKKKPA